MQVSVQFGVDGVLEEYGDGHWTAKVETLGLVVHADTESEVRTKVRQAMEVLLEVFGEDVDKARRFLDHHHIESTLTTVPDEPVSVPDEPVSVPDEPVSVPDEPVSYRHQHRERWQHEVAGVVPA